MLWNSENNSLHSIQNRTVKHLLTAWNIENKDQILPQDDLNFAKNLKIKPTYFLTSTFDAVTGIPSWTVFTGITC